MTAFKNIQLNNLILSQGASSNSPPPPAPTQYWAEIFRGRLAGKDSITELDNSNILTATHTNTDPITITEQDTLGVVVNSFTVNYSALMADFSSQLVGALLKDNDGNFFLVADVSGGGINKYMVTKFDSSNTEVWNTIIESPHNTNYLNNAVYDANSNSIFINNYSSDSAGNTFITRINAETGSIVWSNEYTPSAGYLDVSKIGTHVSGDLFLAVGAGIGGLGTSSVELYRLDPTDGSIILQKRFASPQLGGVSVYGIDSDEDGNVYISGTAFTDGGSGNAFTLVTDANGSSILWDRTLDQDGLWVDAQSLGNGWFAGFLNVSIVSSVDGSSYVYSVAKFDASGDLVSNGTYEPTQGLYFGAPLPLKDVYYVSGGSMPNNSAFYMRQLNDGTCDPVDFNLDGNVISFQSGRVAFIAANFSTTTDPSTTTSDAGFLDNHLSPAYGVTVPDIGITQVNVDSDLIIAWDQTSNLIQVPNLLSEFTISVQAGPVTGLAWNTTWSGTGPGPTLGPVFEDPGTATLTLNYDDLWLSAGTATITASKDDLTSNEIVIHVTQPKETLVPDTYLSGVGTFASIDEIPTVVEIMVGVDDFTIPSGVSQVKVNGVGGDGVPGIPVFSNVSAQWPRIIPGEESILVTGDNTTLFRNQFDFGSANDWETLTKPGGDWRFTIFGWGLSIFVGFPFDDTITWVSDDNGDTWTQGTIPAAAPQNWEAVAYGDGLFVALEPSGTKGYTSTDGLVWTEIVVPNSGRRRLTFGGDKFVASGGGVTLIGTLAAGVITWATASTPLVTQPLAILYSDDLNRFVLADYATANGYYSDDGITWTAMSLPRDSWITGTYGSGQFVLGSNDTPANNGAAYSSDGITWFESDVGTGTRRCAAWRGGEMAMLTGGGPMTLHVSNDSGVTWYLSETNPIDGPTAYVNIPEDGISLEFLGGEAGGPAEPRAEYTETIVSDGATVSYEVPTDSYAALSYFGPL
jgi:hypothetical protein